ncbi:FlaD/FlaE family flagellar protein [Natronocalculus amylovorans]|uniref:Archaeal flagella protein FlaD/E domain-containing protein n=1 Tax=Natronocalculus amylovorans TaxID=2917812 RepID=A0AAE3FVL5_9EURY|nr:FlaD/FlaE family flagellar protein [Natronocalculus amylovorans]MCL9815434.1 hypothetical protein [Natronocalculus amylovorans]NUE02052.1 hypothetical protein [Halorubraceae archaeon YAN]
MGVNPREYDPTELRSLAGIAEPEVRSTATVKKSLTAEESVRAQQFKELLALRTKKAADGLERPYLRTIPDTDLGRRLLYDWVEFLTLVGGHAEARTALRYYKQLGWITPAIQHTISGEVGSLPEPVHARSFEIGDHRLSLLYIATLASLS